MANVLRKAVAGPAQSRRDAGSRTAAPLRAQVREEVRLDSALVPIVCAALLYAVSWVMGCSSAPAGKPAGGKKVTQAVLPQLSPDDVNDKLTPALSGRKLTVEKMAQRAASSLQYANEEYGIAFDAPKGYQLKEGELPQMDRGLGYLGPIPMHFAQPGGIRLATVEPPAGIHVGTNFVNEFFTVSAHYGATPAVCAQFDIPEGGRTAALTRTIESIEFHGFEERAAASMHQYRGVYLHGYANETCYEIGYGVATAGVGASSSLKGIDEEKRLKALERILGTVRIEAPAFENPAKETSEASGENKNSSSR